MEQNTYTATIKDQTRRALWEVKNIIDCVPDYLWAEKYGEMPLWKHIYHMLHSLDLWFINPRDPNFTEPSIHEKDLNNLDLPSAKQLTRSDLENYYQNTAAKINAYLETLHDEILLSNPPACEYTRFTLILAQFRHLHCHLGMLMGFLIKDLNQWPRVLGLEGTFPTGSYPKIF